MNNNIMSNKIISNNNNNSSSSTKNGTGSSYIHALEMESDDPNNHHHQHPDDEEEDDDDDDDYLTDDDNYGHITLLGSTNGTNGGYKPIKSNANANVNAGNSRSWIKTILILSAIALVVIGSSIVYKKGKHNDNNKEDIDKTSNTSPVTSPTTGGDTPTTTATTTTGTTGQQGEEQKPTPTTVEDTTPTTSNNSEGETTTPKTYVENIPDDTPLLQNGYKYSDVSKIIPDPDRLPLDDTTKQTFKDKYGKWKFFDGDENNRPQEDYCGKYPNRDIPGDQFPDGAWQTDAVYVNHIINEAEQLISRAKEAIFEEYGHSKIGLRPEQLKERLQMFHVEQLNDMATIPDKYMKKRGERDTGGWTTKRSWDGLVRRLLHAIMTNDNFTVVLAGHSAAAGHGNHFHQSYMMQFHKILAPVFARLGVKLITRNLSQGGLGTLHNSIGMRSLYGSAIDILAWDSGMTENDPIHVDVFFRQGLLHSTSKVPFLWTGSTMWNILKFLHDNANADIAEYGTGMIGIPETVDETQVETLPYAVRYMKCIHDRQDLCQNAPRFCAKCWIPPFNTSVTKEMFTKIDTAVGSQVKWHPGWRVHQLQGRVLAFTILDALQDAIQIFSDQTMAGPPLDDSFWHVTDYYTTIRTKVIALQNQGECSKIGYQNNQMLPKRICGLALHGRSLYTPRSNPSETSLTSIIVPAPDDGYKPINTNVMIYDGPDGHNTCYDIPSGQVDVLSIISHRRRQRNRRQQQLELEIVQHLNDTVTATSEIVSRQLDSPEDAIVTGKGWIVLYEPPGQCDGSYDAICGRAKWSTCPAIGHHDARGVLLGDEYAGWIVFNIPKMEHGIIVVKLITYLASKDNWKTMYWKSVNNVQGSGTSTSSTGTDTTPTDQNNNDSTNTDTTGSTPPDTTPDTSSSSSSSSTTTSETNSTPTDDNNNNNRQRRLFRSNANHQRQLVSSSLLVHPTVNLTGIDVLHEEYDTIVSSSSIQQYGDFENSIINKNNNNNNEDTYTRIRQDRRQLGGGTDVNGYPDTTIFEYAIDGKITSLTKTELIAAIKKPQRVIEFLTFLDDPNFITTRTNPATDPVQVAIRLRNCGRDCPLAISHLYWA